MSYCSHGFRRAEECGFGLITLGFWVVNMITTWLDIPWSVNHLKAFCMILRICMIIQTGQMLIIAVQVKFGAWNLSLAATGSMLPFPFIRQWHPPENLIEMHRAWFSGFTGHANDTVTWNIIITNNDEVGSIKRDFWPVILLFIYKRYLHGKNKLSYEQYRLKIIFIYKLSSN